MAAGSSGQKSAAGQAQRQPLNQYIAEQPPCWQACPGIRASDMTGSRGQLRTDAARVRCILSTHRAHAGTEKQEAGSSGHTLAPRRPLAATGSGSWDSKSCSARAAAATSLSSLYCCVPGADPVSEDYIAEGTSTLALVTDRAGSQLRPTHRGWLLAVHNAVSRQSAAVHTSRKCSQLWPGLLALSLCASGVLPRAKYMGACRSLGCTLQQKATV